MSRCDIFHFADVCDYVDRVLSCVDSHLVDVLSLESDTVDIFKNELGRVMLDMLNDVDRFCACHHSQDMCLLKVA